MEEFKSNNKITNFLLVISLLAAIANFIVTLMFKNDKDLLINLIMNFLLCTFTCFYILSVFSSRKRKKGQIIMSALILILFNGVQITNNLGYLKVLELANVEDFTNKSLIDVIKWSEKNNIKIKQIYEYSDIVSEYKIINQDKKNDLLKNTKSLTVTVSEGPNPDKEVIIQNMSGWSDDRVIDVIKKNFLNNVAIEFIVSDNEKNTLIEQSKSGSIKRNDEIKFTFSLGNPEDLESVKLQDLSKKDEFDATYYLKKNGIKYEIEREFSKDIPRGKVIKMDKSPGTVITPNSDEVVKITISKGEKIKVPDLSKYTTLDITKWIIKNKLKLEINEKYDDTVKKNHIIESNFKKGDIIEQKTVVSITISRGNLVMRSFKTLDDFKKWANDNNINYEEKHEFSDSVKSGEVISYSHRVGDVIKNDDMIVITISDGVKTTVPDLIGDTKNDAIKKLEKAKINYNFVYENSTKDKNIVIKQSLASGSDVAEDITITLTLSNGKKPTTNSSTTTDNNKKSQVQNNNTNTNQVEEEKCDTSKGSELDIQTGTTGKETASMIKKLNPNHHFDFEYVENCNNGSTTPGSVCGVIDGAYKNYCEIIKITIVE